MKTAALLFVLLQSTAALAQGPVITVDHLSCAKAQSFVKHYERYFVQSRDGVIPITHVRPMGGDAYCKVHERIQFHAVSTLDNSHCFIGMTCVAN